MVFMCVTHQWVSHMWQKSSFLLATIPKLTSGSLNMAAHHSDNVGRRGSVPNYSSLPSSPFLESLSDQRNRDNLYFSFISGSSFPLEYFVRKRAESSACVQPPACACFPSLDYGGHLTTERLWHLQQWFSSSVKWGYEHEGLLWKFNTKLLLRKST